MKHVSLDTQDEAIQQFVLGLAADPDESKSEGFLMKRYRKYILLCSLVIVAIYAPCFLWIKLPLSSTDRLCEFLTFPIAYILLFFWITDWFSTITMLVLFYAGISILCWVLSSKKLAWIVLPTLFLAYSLGQGIIYSDLVRHLNFHD